MWKVYGCGKYMDVVSKWKVYGEYMDVYGKFMDVESIWMYVVSIWMW
jgi:hypothetical protein